MKNAVVALVVALLSLGLVGTASAVPFQIGDRGLVEVDTTGGLNYGYPLTVGSLGGFSLTGQAIAHSEFSLGVGDFMDLDLFRVEVAGLATGKITATVQFLKPVVVDVPVPGTINPGPPGLVLDTIVLTGEFGLLGGNGLGAAFITWDGPVVVGYGNGGLFQLALDDVQSSGSDNFLITGRVTNLQTPEPASLLLLGTGLLGIAVGRRKTGW